MTYVLSTGLTQAALITTNTMSISDDFSNFEGLTKTGGPVTLASRAIFTSTNNNAVIGDLTYPLNENGSWNAGRDGFTGLNAYNGSMTFSLPYEVNYVGGFLNYNFPLLDGSEIIDLIITALDRDGDLLESYTLNTLAPISTPGGLNEGAFRGISRDTFDIAAFRVSNGFVVLDDLTFHAAVPVPAALWLFGSGLLGLVAVAKRKVRA